MSGGRRRGKRGRRKVGGKIRKGRRERGERASQIIG